VIYYFQILREPYKYICQIPGKQVRTKLADVSYNKCITSIRMPRSSFKTLCYKVYRVRRLKLINIYCGEGTSVIIKHVQEYW